jgi:hypothetical protein
MNTQTTESAPAAQSPPVTVELWIDVTVHDAALKQAKRQGERLAAVTRAALFTAAATARRPTGFVLASPEGKWDGEIYPTEDAAEEAGIKIYGEAADFEYGEVTLDGEWTDFAARIEVPKIKPRQYVEDRKRIRFKVPELQKTDVWKRIEAAGESVPSAVERFLRLYIETGTIVNA